MNAHVRRRRLAMMAAATLPLLWTLTPVTVQAAPEGVSGVSLEWDLNAVHQGAAPNGGCDYFSAGESDGTQAGYRTSQGDVQVFRRDGAGTPVETTYATRCSPADGSAIGQVFRLNGGTGTQDLETGALEVRWDGTVSVSAYGGLTPWYLADPVLTLDEDGDGELVADVGGFASSIENPNVKEPLPPIEDVTIATVRSADTSSETLTITPEFAGVDYFPIVDGQRSATSAIGDTAKAGNPQWGSWPTEFTDFQYQTGLSSYWHTSGGSADPKKPPTAFAVELDGGPVELGGGETVLPPTIVDQPDRQGVVPGSDVTFAVVAEGTTLTYQWQRNLSGSWTDLDGETDRTLTLQDVGTDLNYSAYRVVVTNSAGEVRSQSVDLRVQAAEQLVIDSSPSDFVGAVGGTYYVGEDGRASGFPDPVYHWETSLDGGATWVEIGEPSSTSLGEQMGPLTTAQDGSLFRFFVDNAVSGPVYSEPATLAVLTIEGRGVAIHPGTLVDPEAETDLSVLGSGFPAAFSGAFVVAAVVEKGAWVPGTVPGQALVLGAKARGIIPAIAYQQTPGFLKTSLKVPAGALDPTKEYEVVTFVFGGADRAFDTATPLTLAEDPVFTEQPADRIAWTGQEVELSAAATAVPAPIYRWQTSTDGETWIDVPGAAGTSVRVTAIEDQVVRALAANGFDEVASEPAEITVLEAPPAITETLDESNAGTVTVPATVRPGETFTVGLPAELEDDLVAVYLHSVPQLLATGVVDAAGTVLATVPVDAVAGAHRVVVLRPDGSLVGWAPITVLAPQVAVPPQAGPVSGSGSGLLPGTGAATSVAAIALAALMAAAGVTLLTTRRRRSAD